MLLLIYPVYPLFNAIFLQKYKKNLKKMMKRIHFSSATRPCCLPGFAWSACPLCPATLLLKSCRRLCSSIAMSLQACSSSRISYSASDKQPLHHLCGRWLQMSQVYQRYGCIPLEYKHHDIYAVFRYSLGVLPVCALKKRMKCCGYSKSRRWLTCVMLRVPSSSRCREAESSRSLIILLAVLPVSVLTNSPKYLVE